MTLYCVAVTSHSSIQIRWVSSSFETLYLVLILSQSRSQTLSQNRLHSQYKLSHTLCHTLDHTVCHKIGRTVCHTVCLTVCHTDAHKTSFMDAPLECHVNCLLTKTYETMRMGQKYAWRHWQMFRTRPCSNDISSAFFFSREKKKLQPFLFVCRRAEILKPF